MMVEQVLLPRHRLPENYACSTPQSPLKKASMDHCHDIVGVHDANCAICLSTPALFSMLLDVFPCL